MKGDRSMVQDRSFDKQNYEYNFVKDYKHNTKLRASFNQLADRIFGIQFEDWYQKGYWNDNYICYSYVWNGEVVANVSINIMEIIISDKKLKAIQIGTVMTEESHRRRGLAFSLLQRVISDYEETCDFFFLAADEEAIPLYERCGFRPYQETEYTIDLDLNFVENLYDEQAKNIHKNKHLKAIQMSPDKLMKLKAFASPLSKSLSAVGDEHILMFYYLLIFKDSFYCWCEVDDEPNYYLLLSIEGDKADWLDLYKDKPLTDSEMKKLLMELKLLGIKTLRFNFTPDVMIEGKVNNAETEGGWMIRAHKGIGFPNNAWFPRISKA